MATSSPIAPGTAADAAPHAFAKVGAASLAAELDEIEPLPRVALDDASRRADAVLAAARALGLTVLAMRAQLVQADVLERRGRPAESGHLTHAVNRWATENDHRYLCARSHYLLEVFFRDMGDDALSLEHAVRAVDLLDDSAPAAIRFDHLVRLADALASGGSYASARARYAQVMRLAELLDVDRQLLVLNNLAYTEYLAGEHERAIEVAGQLQALAAASGMPMHSGRLDTVARAQMGMGRFAEAERTILPVLGEEVTGQVPDGDSAPLSLLTLAEVQRHLGATDRAQVSLDACLRLCVERDLRAVAVRVREQQAELHAAAGDFAAAYQQHKLFHQESVSLQSAERDARARTLQVVFETSEAREQSRRYREMSLRDPLTGLYNRRYVDEELPALLRRRGAGDGGVLSVALLDLDHFKRVNDTFSHHVGDEVLRVVADLLGDAVSRLASRTSRSAFVARMGGEEFLLVFEAESAPAARHELQGVADCIRSHPWSALTGTVPVTASIGATTCTSADAALPTPELLRRADRSLYTAKHTGRDRVVDEADAAVRAP